MSWSFIVSIITTLTCEHVTRPGNLRTLSLPLVNMVPVPWVFDDFWGSAYRTVLGTEVQKFMHLSVTIKNCEDVLVRVPTYFFVHGVDEESEVRKKKKQHLSSIIIREPSSASSLEKLEISYARDLILNSWKIKGLHARWISEHLCTLRDGALDQARHMWPQGRVQPTEQTAQRPIHHTTRRNQLPLKTKRW